MNKITSLIATLKSLGHQVESAYLSKVARKSDQDYHNLSEEIFSQFLTANVSAYYDPSQDPIIGPTRQVTCIDFSKDFNIENLNLKIIPDEICVGIVRPLSDQLLSSYGLSRTQIKKIRADYPFCFFWEQNKSGDAFDVDSNSAGMDLYPSLSQFSKIETILPRIAHLSWFQVILKVDPSIKVSFDHEITHLINSMRGSKLPTEDMTEEENLSSTEEIQATYMEIFKQIRTMFDSRDSYLIQLLATNNHQEFIKYIFHKYDYWLGVGIISAKAKDKYILKFSRLFLELREEFLAT